MPYQIRLTIEEVDADGDIIDRDEEHDSYTIAPYDTKHQANSAIKTVLNNPPSTYAFACPKCIHTFTQALLDYEYDSGRFIACPECGYDAPVEQWPSPQEVAFDL